MLYKKRFFWIKLSMMVFFNKNLEHELHRFTPLKEKTFWIELNRILFFRKKIEARIS